MNRRELDWRDCSVAALRYMQSAATIAEQGLYAEAGEIMWGALVNALNALARTRLNRDMGTNGARRQFMKGMIEAGALTQSDLNSFFANGVSMHSHFYRPWLTAEPHPDAIDDASGLANRLLAAADGEKGD